MRSSNIFKLTLLAFLFSCSAKKDDPTSSTTSAYKKNLSTIAVTHLNLDHYTEDPYAARKNPSSKYFHLEACFEKRVPNRKLKDELWEIVELPKRTFPADANGCVRWVEEVLVDHTKKAGSFNLKRTFSLSSSQEKVEVFMHVDPYGNVVKQGIPTLESPDGANNKEGFIAQATGASTGYRQQLNPIAITKVNLDYFAENNYKSSNTPDIKYFHISACFKFRDAKAPLADELWIIKDISSPPIPSDVNGCVIWSETVKMDYTLSKGSYPVTRNFRLLATGQHVDVHLNIDPYKNKVSQNIKTINDPEGNIDPVGIVTQKMLITDELTNAILNDPIKETGDIQILSDQEAHIPFLTYRISLQIPNRITANYERLQGEPLEVRLERIDGENKIYIPVLEREGKEVKSHPYGATNVAFDLDYNRYSPLRWIPYRLHITPKNPAFKNHGLSVKLCIKPWEGQKYSVYDSSFGECPEANDPALRNKQPEIYFNHVSFKQIGQEETGYKLNKYLDVSLQKKWRLTLRPYVNYWHNFESSNHYFPLLSGNFKVRVVLLAYKKGDTLSITKEDLDQGNFEVIAYSDPVGKVNKGNFITDVTFEFPFKKWYRLYTRTFAAIQILPEDEVLNPYLKSGLAVIPFHAADRDYSIYVKTDYFSDIDDPQVLANRLTPETVSSHATDLGATQNGFSDVVELDDKLNNRESLTNRPLVPNESDLSKGRVVFEGLKTRFFLDEEKKEYINAAIARYIDMQSFLKQSKNVGTPNYMVSPEETARLLMNSSPVFKPLERFYVNTEAGQDKMKKVFAQYLRSTNKYIGNPQNGNMVSIYENAYPYLDYSLWPTEGLDTNAKQAFCKYFFRAGNADQEPGPTVHNSKTFQHTEIFDMCLERPDMFIHVDTLSYVQNVKDHKFVAGMEVRHNIDKRVNFYNSYNDRESMSARLNFAIGLEKWTPTEAVQVGKGAVNEMIGKRAAESAAKDLNNTTRSKGYKFTKWFLNSANVALGAFDIGRYWGLDHSFGRSDGLSRGETISLTSTKHDVTFTADVRNCAIVRFKLPDEIAASYTYFDKSNYVSFGHMWKGVLESFSEVVGHDFGKKETARDTFNKLKQEMPQANRDFLEAATRRFEFCSDKIDTNQKITESWYYLGSDLGYHSGSLDPLSLKHNPFMKLVRGTKSFDELIEHISSAVEVVFVDQAKEFAMDDNVGDLAKKVYQTPKHGHPQELNSELVSMIGLPGVIRRQVKTDNLYYVQQIAREKIFKYSKKEELNELIDDDEENKNSVTREKFLNKLWEKHGQYTQPLLPEKEKEN